MIIERILFLLSGFLLAAFALFSLYALGRPENLMRVLLLAVAPSGVGCGVLFFIAMKMLRSEQRTASNSKRELLRFTQQQKLELAREKKNQAHKQLQPEREERIKKPRRPSQ